MRGRGFSLMEALVSMMVLSLALTVAASLFSGYARVSRHTQVRDRILLEAAAALERLQEDFHAAVGAIQVSPAQVELSRVDRRLVRFPEPRPPAWKPHDAAFLNRVAYRVAEDALIREVDGSERTLLAGGVRGFEVENADPVFRIRLDLETTAGERRLEAVVTRRVGR